MNWEDPIVADVRRIREELSAKFAFDVAAIFADIRVRQTEVGHRLVRLQRKKAKQTAGAERPIQPESNG